MTAGLSAVVVGADRLGNIPDLLKGHNISITHHISGRDPSHQKKTLQLPSGTQLVILLTDFLGHNVMKTFRNAAQRGGIRVVACRRSVCSMQQALQQCGLCRARARARCTDSDAVPAGRSADNRSRLGGLRACGAKRREENAKRRRTFGSDGVFVFVLAAMSPAGARHASAYRGGRAGRGHHVVVQAAGAVVALGPVRHGHVLDADHAAGAGE